MMGMIVQQTAAGKVVENDGCDGDGRGTSHGDDSAEKENRCSTNQLYEYLLYSIPKSRRHCIMIVL